MSEPGFSLARIILPTDAATSMAPSHVAARLKGFLGRIFGYLDANLIPNPPETYHERWTRTEFIYARRLRTMVLRLEYTLRCFLLFLAGELLKTEAGRDRVRASLKPLINAPRQARPYDPLIQLQEKTPRKRAVCAPAASCGEGTPISGCAMPLYAARLAGGGYCPPHSSAGAPAPGAGAV